MLDCNGAPGRDRTCGTWIRNPLLYPLSYGGKQTENDQGGGQRTGGQWSYIVERTGIVKGIYLPLPCIRRAGMLFFLSVDYAANPPEYNPNAPPFDAMNHIANCVTDVLLVILSARNSVQTLYLMYFAESCEPPFHFPTEHHRTD